MGLVLPQYPCVPWKPSSRQAWHGMAVPGDGTWESRAHSGGCKVVDGSSQKMALQSVPKRNGSLLASQSHSWLWGRMAVPSASHHGIPRGQGRAVQPNAFQKISDEWLGRVIRIKPIKPLLAS